MKSKINVKEKINKEDYCQFLISAQNNFTMTAMSEFYPQVAHDKINRWTKETKLTPSILWKYTKLIIKNRQGYMIVDNTIIEKNRGKAIDLTQPCCSSSDKKYVNDLNLTSLIWGQTAIKIFPLIIGSMLQP